MKLSGDEFLETAPKFRKRKKNSSSCVYILHKTCHQEISLPSRAVTAKKYTKKCNARAELLFWLQNLLLFFDVLAAVAVALLKLPNDYSRAATLEISQECMVIDRRCTYSSSVVFVGDGYVGCFEASMLTDYGYAKQSLSSVTPEDCIAQCKTNLFTYAALQNGKR